MTTNSTVMAWAQTCMASCIAVSEARVRAGTRAPSRYLSRNAGYLVGQGSRRDMARGCDDAKDEQIPRFSQAFAGAGAGAVDLYDAAARWRIPKRLGYQDMLIVLATTTILWWQRGGWRSGALKTPEYWRYRVPMRGPGVSVLLADC